MVIEVENLVKRYGNKVVLDHINLKIEEGEIFGLLGPSGSGKTTVIQSILAILKYDKGKVHIFGEEMKPNSYEIKRNIGVVMENVAIFPELTVYENVYYFCNLYLKEKERIKEYVKEALEKTKLLNYANYYPKKLSEGQCRRLNLACGIVHKPRLLILDEPLNGIDPKSRLYLMEQLRNIKKSGTTILYSTYSFEEAEEFCDHLAIMDKGKIIAQGTKQELTNMISLGERISMEVYDLTEKQLQEIKEINHVYSVEYKDHNLEIKSSKGKNNLMHVMTYLAEHNIAFGKVFTELPTLNDVFLEMTGNEILK